MAPTIEVTVSYGDARRMITVSDAASRQADRGSLSSTHEKVLEIVGRKVSSSLTEGCEGLFGVRSEGATAATFSLEQSTLEAYLKTLDRIATQTPKPHVRNTCQTLCTRLINGLDVDALGLHLEQYRTLKIKRQSVF
jgi:hypothetical protein